jgi:hypothetical protein
VRRQKGKEAKSGLGRVAARTVIRCAGPAEQGERAIRDQLSERFRSFLGIHPSCGEPIDPRKSEIVERLELLEFRTAYGLAEPCRSSRALHVFSLLKLAPVEQADGASFRLSHPCFQQLLSHRITTRSQQKMCEIETNAALDKGIL